MKKTSPIPRHSRASWRVLLLSYGILLCTLWSLASAEDATETWFVVSKPRPQGRSSTGPFTDVQATVPEVSDAECKEKLLITTGSNICMRHYIALLIVFVSCVLTAAVSFSLGRRYPKRREYGLPPSTDLSEQRESLQGSVINKRYSDDPHLYEMANTVSKASTTTIVPYDDPNVKGEKSIFQIYAIDVGGNKTSPASSDLDEKVTESSEQPVPGLLRTNQLTFSGTDGNHELSSLSMSTSSLCNGSVRRNSPGLASWSYVKRDISPSPRGVSALSRDNLSLVSGSTASPTSPEIYSCCLGPGQTEIVNGKKPFVLLAPNGTMGLRPTDHTASMSQLSFLQPPSRKSSLGEGTCIGKSKATRRFSAPPSQCSVGKAKFFYDSSVPSAKFSSSDVRTHTDSTSSTELHLRVDSAKGGQGGSSAPQMQLPPRPRSSLQGVLPKHLPLITTPEDAKEDGDAGSLPLDMVENPIYGGSVEGMTAITGYKKTVASFSAA